MSEVLEERKGIVVVKSPFPRGIEKLPPIRYVDNVTVNIMMPDGIVITNPEQFDDTRDETAEAYSEDCAE